MGENAVVERRTSIAIEHALDLLQVLADLFAGLGRESYRRRFGGRHCTGWVGRTFFLGSPGGADSSLRMLSRRPRTRSVGVRCLVLKKFMDSLREGGRLMGSAQEGGGRKG